LVVSDRAADGHGVGRLAEADGLHVEADLYVEVGVRARLEEVRIA
jgi:hypothetical protein